MRRKKSINVVLAEALKHYMGDHWTPYSLAKKSGVAEGTIRNYLAPEKRQPSASGKEPSAKLTEVEMLAEALGVEFCDLTTDATELQLPHGDGRVHVVVIPTGYLEASRCVIAVAASGTMSTSCTARDIDLPHSEEP